MEGGCFQFNPKNIFFIFYIKVLASVLHLGNIHFNALDKEGTEVIIVIVMIAIMIIIVMLMIMIIIVMISLISIIRCRFQRRRHLKRWQSCWKFPPQRFCKSKR